ncbi:hypothetical protein BDZ89DRAFT_1136612 [Hymenopellis radicata]|nr:hypothetical protein BDZ89DRAFT_1136612 [Hymenopellis radicata]
MVLKILSDEALSNLHRLVLRTLLLDPSDESPWYGIIDEVLAEHKMHAIVFARVSRDSLFFVIPQLFCRSIKRRYARPDMAVARITKPTSPSGVPRLRVGGGWEQKPAIKDLMTAVKGRKGPPDVKEVAADGEFIVAISHASGQASDQVKAAIRAHYINQTQVVCWVLAVGPYFVVRTYGNFSDAEMLTTTSRPNDSGDYEVTELRKAAARVPKLERVYMLGTEDGARKVYEFLRGATRVLDQY